MSRSTRASTARALPCSPPTCSRRRIGYPRAPVDDLLVFHTVFGKTVPDISLNAIANLGYAECRFLAPVYPGDTLSAASEVIGLRENSNRASGVVYVRTTGRNQQRRDGARVRALGDGEEARQRRRRRPPPVRAEARRARRSRRRSAQAVPTLDSGRATTSRWPARRIAGATTPPGEKIDHADAMTLEEAEHQIATRLYQNTAKVHFNLHEQAQGQFKRRLVYGGVVISLARALSFNGLANAFHIAAINGGRHVAPCFAGDTVYAWSEVLETAEIPGRSDIGALRMRLIAVKNRTLRRLPPAQRQGRLRRRRHPRSRPVARAAALRRAPGLLAYTWHTVRQRASSSLLMTFAQLSAHAAPR